MTKEKQIEEMAKAIFLNCHCGLFEDEAKMIAKFCYQEIDRKASEIFEEIEKYLVTGCTFYGQAIHSIGVGTFARLKKKHTEEGK